jgi:hypothetical protein
MITKQWAADTGLREGQMRAGEDKITHNSGWYNLAGEKIGWGDLGKRDMAAILATLPASEAFIVLSEQNSFWKFVTHIGAIGSLCRTTGDAEKPGLEYVLEHAMLCVKDGRIIYVSDFQPADNSWLEKNKIGQVLPEIMGSSEFAAFIQATTTGAHNA